MRTKGRMRLEDADLVPLGTVCEVLGKDRRRVRAAIRRGTLPRPFRVLGREAYYRRSWLESWLSGGRWPEECCWAGD